MGQDQWQGMHAKGEVAKMGVEDPRPKGNGGTDVTGQRGGWVLDGSGFRRVGSEETGEGRSPRVEKLPAFSLGSRDSLP